MRNSYDTLVVLGLVALFRIDHDTIGPANGTTPMAGFLLFYGLVSGGARLYLAIRGEGGTVPVKARWRFIALLAVLLGAGVVMFYAGERTIAPVSLGSIGLVVILITSSLPFLSNPSQGIDQPVPSE
ncbi:MAG: hypothetical protein ACI9YT_000959 [Halobacteriales archaeon]